MFKVLVCGGRNFGDPTYFPTDKEKLAEAYRQQDFTFDTLTEILSSYKDLFIIAGAALGVDTNATGWASSKGIPYREYPADWEKHGKAAGPIRNKQMLDEGKPDLVIAFPGGRGTANMVKQARERGIEVREIKYDDKT